MPSITYESNSGRTLDLNGSIQLGRSLGLRGRRWAYESDENALSAITREAIECEAELLFHDSDSLREAGNLFDLDMAGNDPATLRIGEWWARVLVPKSEAKMANGRWFEQDATIVLLDGVWRKSITERFDRVTATSGYGLDYPHDYDMDYAPPSPARTITNDGLSPADIRLVVYATSALSDPVIIIAGNEYEVECDLSAGERLEIDTMAKTVKSIGRFGAETNLFGSASRGSGSYIFQKVPAGESPISWDESFVFDLTIYQESGEPPWD